MTSKYPIEAQVAAKWWADLLRERPSRMHDNGDLISEAICEVIAANSPASELSPQQIDLFEELLAAIVTKKFIQAVGWKIDNPLLGSACRVLAVDYGACGELRAAYQGAGGSLNVSVFPIKTTMWVSPGKVTVRLGYTGKETVIYPA